MNDFESESLKETIQRVTDLQTQIAHRGAEIETLISNNEKNKIPESQFLDSLLNLLKEELKVGTTLRLCYLQKEDMKNQLLKRINKLNQQNRSFLSKISSLLNTNISSFDHLFDLFQNIYNEKMSLENEIKTFQTSSENNKKSSIAKNEHLYTKLEHLQKYVNELNQSQQTLRSQILEKDQHILSLVHENEILQANNCSLNQRIQELSDSNKLLEENISKMKDKIQQIKRKKKDLKSQIQHQPYIAGQDKMKDSCDNMNQKCLDSTLDYSKKLEKTNNRLVELEVQCSAVSSRYENLQNHFKEISQKNSDLEEQLSKSLERIDQLKKESLQTASDFKKSSEEFEQKYFKKIQELKRKHRKKEKDLENALEENVLVKFKEIEQQLNIKDNKISKLLSSLSSTQSDLENSKRNCCQLHQTIKQNEIQMMVLKTENERLRNNIRKTELQNT